VIAGIGTLTIGRRSSCDLVLNDRQVSREHARIIVGAESAAVEDLGSSNGISVNGQRVKGLRRLQVGDQIKIGSQLVEVVGFSEGAPVEEDATEIRNGPVLHDWSDDDENGKTKVSDHDPRKR
jgi:pSer/pThr/pTyr-binding forkhead associated (FHA) protein